MKTAKTGMVAVAAMLMLAVPAMAITAGLGDSDPVLPSAPSSGDTNGDGVIDDGDFADLQGTLGFALPGDLDGDGDVDNADIARAAGSFTGTNGSSSMTFADGDVDGDGDVDNADIAVIIGSFTGSGPTNIPPVGTIPEPLTMAMFGIAALAAGRYVRRRVRA